jgi:hypothetical protein
MEACTFISQFIFLTTEYWNDCIERSNEKRRVGKDSPLLLPSTQHYNQLIAANGKKCFPIYYHAMLKFPKH